MALDVSQQNAPSTSRGLPNGSKIAPALKLLPITMGFVAIACGEGAQNASVVRTGGGSQIDFNGPVTADDYFYAVVPPPSAGTSYTSVTGIFRASNGGYVMSRRNANDFR